MFTVLNSFEINNSKYLELYAYFLHDVIHDEFESKRIAEKLDLMIKNKNSTHELQDDRNDGFVEGSESLIITISGNRHNLGQVVSIGTEVKAFLKYKPSDVVGNKIDMLMPKFFAVNHDNYLKRYLDTGSAHIVGKKRNIYTLDRQGYLKGCSLFVKVLPDLSDGIQFIGMIREFDINALNKMLVEQLANTVSHYMIYDSETGIILGISYTLFKYFGLKSSMFKVQSNNTPII